MQLDIEFSKLVRESAEKEIIYTQHALDEMNGQDELITSKEVKEVLFKGEIIEDYPDDKRGHSCLMFAITTNERPVHIVCAPKEEYLAIITAYVTYFGEMGARFQDEEEEMKCLLCKGEMEKSQVTYTIDRKGYHLFLEKIPAYVCSQCGEKYFEEKEIDAIQNMIKALEDRLAEVVKVA